MPIDVCEKMCQLPKGLVLITGSTGSGKSTTLAAMIDYINSNRYDHIVTIEDPIEFVHPNKLALINQREVGSDTHSFTEALRHVLRQDPDVVLVGEMRDMETIDAGLTLSDPPYRAQLVSVDFDGDDVVFDGYGIPDDGGGIVIACGGVTRTVNLDGETGAASVE